MNINEMLEAEITEEFENLKKVEGGSEEHVRAVDSLTKLVDRSIELEKNKRDNRGKWVSNGIAIAGVVLPVIVTIWGTKTTLRFEKEDVVTSSAGRQFINRLFKK